MLPRKGLQRLRGKGQWHGMTLVVELPSPPTTEANFFPALEGEGSQLAEAHDFGFLMTRGTEAHAAGGVVVAMVADAVLLAVPEERIPTSTAGAMLDFAVTELMPLQFAFHCR